MAESKNQPQGIKMLHPDHENREDGGIYYAESEVEAMQLGTRGYRRADSADTGTGKKPPAQGGKTANAAAGSAPADG